MKCQFKPEWLNPNNEETNDLSKFIQNKKEQEAERKK